MYVRFLILFKKTVYIFVSVLINERKIGPYKHEKTKTRDRDRKKHEHRNHGFYDLIFFHDY